MKLRIQTAIDSNGNEEKSVEINFVYPCVLQGYLVEQSGPFMCQFQ